MASDNVEIEIKIPLSSAEFSSLKEKVQEIAKFDSKAKQVDEYFTPAHRNFMQPDFPFEWLSIRKRGEKTILSYKHYYPENSEIMTHCDEFETEVKYAEQLEKILSTLDFKALVTVEKERETFVYNNEFEIALDSVRELGYFVEIESLKDFGSKEATRKKLFEFAKGLNLDVFKTDDRGYPFLLLRKKGLVDAKKFLTH